MTATFQTLISVEQLNAYRDHDACVIVDSRYSLTDAGYGARCYAEGHIPGARFVDLDAQLSAPKRPDSGRHPLPKKAQFVASIRQLGIRNGDQVVVYDDVSGGVGGRFWWMLRWAGHRNVAVLDGGINAWTGGGLSLSTEAPRIAPSDFDATFDDSLWVSTKDVVAALADERQLVVDARAPKRFRGETEPIDPIAGHIPGSKNWPLTNNLDPNGCYLGAEALRQILTRDHPDWGDKTAIHSCGSGVSACHNVLAWELAGFGPSKLYVGSWSEWITDASRGVGVVS